MTDVYNQKRIASELLKCGINRVWVDEEALSDVALAMTRDDVRKLIADGTIRQRQKIGISRGRARHHIEQRKKNQQRGLGKRKGAKNARLPVGGTKRIWINRIRSQRQYLRSLRDTQQLTPSEYRKYYMRAKGGQFRSISYLRGQLQDSGMLKGKGKGKTASRTRGKRGGK
ncbi:MAG: 50S ribosomal protein L19e [Candidatus Thorarchaeota archaeon]